MDFEESKNHALFFFGPVRPFSRQAPVKKGIAVSTGGVAAVVDSDPSAKVLNESRDFAGLDSGLFSVGRHQPSRLATKGRSGGWEHDVGMAPEVGFPGFLARILLQ